MSPMDVNTLVLASLDGNVGTVQELLVDSFSTKKCLLWRWRRPAGHRRMNENAIMDVDRPRDEDGTTALLAASYSGRLCVVRLLLEYGANVNQANRSHKDGATPLFMAAQGGHVDVLAVLLSSGANVDQALDSGPTPLWVACQNGHLQSVKLLLEHGADIDQARNHDDGTTSLFVAAQGGHVDVVKTLLQYGAAKSINQASAEGGATPLFVAAQSGHLQVVETLLEFGAKADQARRDGITPAYIAVQTCMWSVLPHLFKHGATVADAMTSLISRDTSCLHWIAAGGRRRTFLDLKDVPEDHDVVQNWDILVRLLWLNYYGRDDPPVLKDTRSLSEEEFREAHRWMIYAAAQLLHVDIWLLWHLTRVYPSEVATQACPHTGYTPLMTALQLFPQYRDNDKVAKGLDYLIKWNPRVLFQQQDQPQKELSIFAFAIQRGAPLATLSTIVKECPISVLLKDLDTGLQTYMSLATTPQYYGPVDFYSISRNVLPHLVAVTRG